MRIIMEIMLADALDLMTKGILKGLFLPFKFIHIIK